MRNSLLIASVASVASGKTLSDICSTGFISSKLPSGDAALQGIVYGDVTAEQVFNTSIEASNNYPSASGRNFCNVTVAYSHAGKDDAVRRSALT